MRMSSLVVLTSIPIPPTPLGDIRSGADGARGDHPNAARLADRARLQLLPHGARRQPCLPLGDRGGVGRFSHDNIGAAQCSGAQLTGDEDEPRGSRRAPLLPQSGEIRGQLMQPGASAASGLAVSSCEAVHTANARARHASRRMGKAAEGRAADLANVAEPLMPAPSKRPKRVAARTSRRAKGQKKTVKFTYPIHSVHDPSLDHRSSGSCSTPATAWGRRQAGWRRGLRRRRSEAPRPALRRLLEPWLQRRTWRRGTPCLGMTVPRRRTGRCRR